MDLSNNRFDPSLLDGIKHKVKLDVTGCRACGGGLGGPAVRPPEVQPAALPPIDQPFFFSKQQSCGPPRVQFLAQRAP